MGRGRLPCAQDRRYRLVATRIWSMSSRLTTGRAPETHYAPDKKRLFIFVQSHPRLTAGMGGKLPLERPPKG